MRLIPGFADYLPFLAAAFVVAALIALLLTPVVRLAAIRLGNIDQPGGAPGQRGADPARRRRRRGGGLPVRGDRRDLAQRADRRGAGPARPGPRGARGPVRGWRAGDGPGRPGRHLPAACPLAARGPAAPRRHRGGRRPRRHEHQQPLRARERRPRRPVRDRLHDAVDRGDDQQHQLHRRARRPLVRHRADRRRDPGPDLAHDRCRPAVHRHPVLRPGGRAAGVPALELPSRHDLHRHGRRDVRGLHARGPLDHGDGEGRGGAPRAGRADHRHVLDPRPPRGDRATRRSRPTAGTSTTACSTWACRTARPCSSSTACASCSPC